MGSEIAFFQALNDPKALQGVVIGTMTSQFSSSINGLVLVGVMSMIVKQFYDVLADKDKRQEEEVLSMVENIW